MLARRCLLTFLLLAAGANQARAHFLWVVSPSGSQTKMQVYFGEAAEPDDPALLEKVQASQVWALGSWRSEPESLKLKLADDALTAEVPADRRSNPIVLRHTYGVFSRGDASFLLEYYAKTYPSALPGSWQEVGDKERLPLEIVPALDGSSLAFTVKYQGQPVAGSEVVIAGPGLKENLKGTTDEQGVFRCSLAKPGLFSIRARQVEETPGEQDGKKYTAIRRYSTLALEVRPPQLAPVATQWPDLPKGITSFGAAVVDDYLYVYGGHFGRPHHYYRQGQSGELLRLNLSKPQQWEPLAGGPGRAGLAMVAHQGKLYRIGGFEATNDEADEQNLISTTDFACYDPASNEWTNLAPLPEGRSSLDAAVLGDTLYVVGGWDMQGDEETQWHETAWSCDLSAEQPEWKALPKPTFVRRALSLAAHQGKLYCIGGMQSEGGPTTKTAVFDPATKKWSDGPSLAGQSMDGFGSSAFAAGGRLYVTTFSGAIQRLSADGKSFEFVGQLQQPRFFHRHVTWNDQMVIVGGASMGTGKIVELERIPTSAATKTTRKESPAVQ